MPAPSAAALTVVSMSVLTLAACSGRELVQGEVRGADEALTAYLVVISAARAETDSTVSAICHAFRDSLATADRYLDTLERTLLSDVDVVRRILADTFEECLTYGSRSSRCSRVMKRRMIDHPAISDSVQRERRRLRTRLNAWRDRTILHSLMSQDRNPQPVGRDGSFSISRPETTHVSFVINKHPDAQSVARLDLPLGDSLLIVPYDTIAFSFLRSACESTPLSPGAARTLQR
jgi:hypothetical protein